jgi:hypothetical protein
MGALLNIERARKGLKVAEAMLSRTYPMAKDPKLFLAVAEDIYFALMECIEALFTINNSPLPEESEDAIEEFSGFASRFGFTPDHLKLVSELHRLIEAHKESPVEFARQDSFVICGEGYDFRKFGEKEMKTFLFDARLFLEKAALAVENNQNG